MTVLVLESDSILFFSIYGWFRGCLAAVEAPGSAIRRFSIMVAARGLIFIFTIGDDDDPSDDDGLWTPTSELDADDECVGDGDETSSSFVSVWVFGVVVW